jgi:hypothetical protein
LCVPVRVRGGASSYFGCIFCKHTLSPLNQTFLCITRAHTCKSQLPMSSVAALNSSPHQSPIDLCSSSGFVTRSLFESLLFKFEAHSVAHRRLESRVSELEEELRVHQQTLIDERARTHEVTQFATRQLQEWTLQGF